MNFVWFEKENGEVVKDWNEVDGKIRSIKLDVVTLGIGNNPPFVVLSGYEKYMYQKYGLCGIGVSSGMQGVVPFAGVQVGGYKNGSWVIIDVNILSRVISIDVKNEITSIAVKDGVI